MAKPIADELREYVSAVRKFYGTDVCGKKREYVDSTTTELLEIADRIDTLHEDRMEQCRYEARRAVLRYLGGVLNDYKKGIKRVRKCDKEDVVRCRDCRWARPEGDDYYVVCRFRPISAHMTDADDYCSHGERREDGDDG